MSDSQTGSKHPLAQEVETALTRADLAQEEYGDFASMHEAYGVIAEEMAELLDAVRMNRRDPARWEAIRAEALDVAAVALRMADQCLRVTR